MGRIFLSSGHDTVVDPGAVAHGTTESEEMILTRNLIEQEFEAQGIEFVSVPDTLSLRETIRWINSRVKQGDVAVELHGNAFNGSVRGTEAFYIAGNDQRRKDAEQLLEALLAEVPELHLTGKPLSRGAKPDSLSQHRGGLAFCRQIAIPSILIELCFIDNKQDLELLQTKRDRFARGLATGLIQWSQQTPVATTSPDPNVNIRINGNDQQEKGILVNHNSFIPVDLVELLSINVSQASNVRKIARGGVVYVKAVDLQLFDVAVNWESNTKTVILNTSTRQALEDADQIMGFGQATEAQLESFLNQNNPEALTQFPNIHELYMEEAEHEGVNYDLAFSQMCLETDYLKFGGQVKPHQNNFCGLGAVDGGAAGAVFNTPRQGVKAHIQHLKAYASKDPILQPPIVDPRFNLVNRGYAPSVYDLAGRWASDLEYGNKIIAILRRIHQVF